MFNVLQITTTIEPDKVNNIYGLLAVVFVVSGIAAFFFFHREPNIWARLIVFFVLLGAGVYSGTQFLKQPKDPDALKKAEEAIQVSEKRAQADKEVIEARLNELEKSHNALDARIRLVDSNHSARQKKIFDSLRQEQIVAQEQRIQAEAEARRIEEEQWTDVRTNIRWVFENSGAKQRYDRFRSRGMSKYDAVIEAQAHNPPVQSGIREYGQERTEAYIRSLGH